MNYLNPIPKETSIYIAGHNGLAGSAIWRRLITEGYTNLYGLSSKELDLRERDSVRDFFKKTKPEIVIDAAAKVGGIHANSTYPADFLSDNLRIQTNLIDAANEFDVSKFLFLGSSCIYPRLAEQPIKETSLLTGLLEPTNDAYAIAKIAGIMQIQASRRQYGRSWISAMPTNLYGPGDNFHPQNSHVLPALMRRIHEAKLTNQSEVVIWGTGTPLREFIHVDDLASACVFLLNNYDDPLPINIGVGKDISIHNLAQLVAKVVGYEGLLTQDSSKPDGTPRKLLDNSLLRSLGWVPTIDLESGLKSTYEWFLKHTDELRQI